MGCMAHPTECREAAKKSISGPTYDGRCHMIKEASQGHKFELSGYHLELIKSMECVVPCA